MMKIPTINYKEIFDANPELTPDTNLYKTNFFKDVSRAVPQNIMKTVLIGIERFGGPVDGYYIGPMTVESEIKDSVSTATAFKLSSAKRQIFLNTPS